MAIIYSYPKVTSPLATDVLVLTDTTLTAGKRKNNTKSLAMSDLAAYVVSSESVITGGGTFNTIPLWTPDGVKLGDSIMTQTVANDGIEVTGNVNILNNFKLELGTTPTLEIYSDGITSFIKETSAAGGNNLNIQGAIGVSLSGAGQNIFTGGGGSNTSIFDGFGVPRLELTINDAVFPSGNVGIGQSNPAVPLYVEGKIRSGDSAAGDYVEVWNDGSQSGWSYITTSSNELVLVPQSGGLVLQGENSGGFGNNASIEIYNALNAAVKVKLDSSGDSYLNGGNVGIGTTTPVSKLQVGTVLSSNKLTIGGYYGLGGGHLAYRSGHQSNSSVWDTAIISATDDGNYNGKIEFKTTTSGGDTGAVPNTKMIIRANGNVGIGTTTPVQTLTVIGNEDLQNVGSYRNTGTGRGLSVRTDSDAVGGDILSLFSGSSYKFWFSRDGNLGLGTANPQSKIEVDGGDIEVDDSARGLILRSPDGTRYRVTVANGGALSANPV
jgi:hypothetical protein